MYSPTATVLLADADSHSGLAVARSLSRHGVSFVVVGRDPGGMVAVSRHVRSYVVAPSAQKHAEAFGKVVFEAAERYGVRLVVPITDSALAVCNEQRDLLPAEARLAAAGSEAVRNVLDKRRNLEMVRRLAIPCPAEFDLTSPEQMPELIARLGFPMVLKNPGFGSGRMSSPLDLKWVIVRNESELRARVAECAAAGTFPIFQQLVEGEVRNLCCFATRGKIVALHQYRSVRRLGWEGTGVVREVTEPTPGLVGYAERLLDELAWEGVAHLGFIVAAPAGDTWYMETNGRFWGSVQGSVRIGWDFPYWTYRYFTAGEIPSPPPLAVGSRSCWRFGDLRLLGKRLRGVEPPMPPRPSKLRALVDYLSDLRVDSDVFALDDPLPELVEHWRGLWLAIGRRVSKAFRD